MAFRFATDNECLSRALGAIPMDDWTTYRLTGETLKK